MLNKTTRSAKTAHKKIPTMAGKDSPERRYRELTEAEREKICSELFLSLRNGALPRGVQTAIAKKYHVHPSTISKLWKKSYVPANEKKPAILSPLSN